MVKNAYIHIPFCKMKCNYCSFVSYETIEFVEKYMEALKKEIKEFYKGEKLETLYIGGGTPSLCTVDQIVSLINLFEFNNESEITIEVNPNDISTEYLKKMLKSGINRLSIGIQTFNDEILKIIGRRHTSKEAINAVNAAKQAGFTNISADLIYGLPMQTTSHFKSDLLSMCDLNLNHISFYGLKIEEGCKFYKNPPLNLPDSDLQADMYELGCELLNTKGYEHYEISNFALPGFYSRHNLNYWDNNSYYGFGAAAHGFDGIRRYANQRLLNKYILNPFNKEEIILITEKESLEEEIFLGFRKSEGINVDKINDKYNIDFEKKYSDVLKKYEQFIIKTKFGYAFNNKGYLISNEILAEFME